MRLYNLVQTLVEQRMKEEATKVPFCPEATDAERAVAMDRLKRRDHADHQALLAYFRKHRKLPPTR